MTMTASVFARELVDRLTGLLPGGFTARADGDTVYVESPDGVGSATSLSHIDPDDLDLEDFSSAAWNVLSMAQDVVSETSGDPWPAGLGPGSELAEPGACIEGGSVHMWFGSQESPVLRLTPIPIEV